MNLRFEQTCYACPEQYDVYDEDTDKLVAYVRLRWSTLRVDCPDVGGEEVFFHEFAEDEGYKGCFDDDLERDYFIKKISVAIKEYYENAS